LILEVLQRIYYNMKTILNIIAGTVLTCAASFAQPASTEQNWTPTVEFEKVEHNFGSIPEGPKANFDFNFTNNGKSPINVVTAQAGCGCTTPEWPRHTIEPGKTGKISVGYNSAGRPGSFSKDVNVTFSSGTNNENQGSMKLTITGNVIAADNTKPKEGNAVVVPSESAPAEKKTANKSSRNIVNSPIPQ
jgi:hypothetical protein